DSIWSGRTGSRASQCTAVRSTSDCWSPVSTSRATRARHRTRCGWMLHRGDEQEGDLARSAHRVDPWRMPSVTLARECIFDVVDTFERDRRPCGHLVCESPDPLMEARLSSVRLEVPEHWPLTLARTPHRLLMFRRWTFLSLRVPV